MFDEGSESSQPSYNELGVQLTRFVDLLVGGDRVEDQLPPKLIGAAKNQLEGLGRSALALRMAKGRGSALDVDREIRGWIQAGDEPLVRLLQSLDDDLGEFASHVRKLSLRRRDSVHGLLNEIGGYEVAQMQSMLSNKVGQTPGGEKYHRALALWNMQ